MFGYVICSKQDLTKEEQMRYQSAYCGLCMTLKRKYGQAARFCLNYDMVFLALFLTSLYEPEEAVDMVHCVVHPTKKQPVLQNRFVEYAADMTILASYFNCVDDWKDEHRAVSRIYANKLEPYISDLAAQYPRQYQCLKQKYEKLVQLESSALDVTDEIINCSGELISELFVYKEDYWSDTLRRFGYEMGRFIYLMDAAIDYEKDTKAGNYNPFVKMKFERERVENILKMMIGNAMEQFDVLPLVKDENILKNILYGGVWIQYNTKLAGKEKSNDRRSL